MIFKYDTSVEVTERIYNQCRIHLGGVMAVRKEGNKYYVKLMLSTYREAVEQILNQLA
jgi:hypothetical protein